ncbi:MAG: G/U mismatch-specific DNA glycosylase [Sporomusaceae bacterium]|nr:G/U mismatch-specific DNA glycosylase [Sporomusaceae bacterium]
MTTVADIIKPRLRILFIGFNPGLRSAETGCHFAGHSNRFWKLLAAAGLTPRQLRPAESRQLLEWGCGITNIVARPSKAAAEISKQEYRQGAAVLKAKLTDYQPAIACYAGIGVYREFSGKKAVACGLQSDSVVPPIDDFVVPSPSGLNRIAYNEQLYWYLELKKHAECLCKNTRLV